MPLLLFAQSSYTISGYIEDVASGERLPSAKVWVEGQGRGSLSNAYGYYSLTLPSDSLELVYAFSGYKAIRRRIYLVSDTVLDIQLELLDYELEEVEIVGKAAQAKLEANQMSKVSLSMMEAKQVPTLLGEVDIIKVLQLMPGVKASSEGSTGLYVRGGGADQNLVLLDEAVVYNTGHLFGFLSVFNGDAVQGLEMYKGGFPARYGGRISSVIDVKMREGNKKKLSGSGGIGLISSRLTLEGPLKRDRSSFIVSGRRTYLDLLSRPVNAINQSDPNWEPIPNYYFYDFNAKLNHQFGERDRLYISGYFGRDFMTYNDIYYDLNLNWGNATTTVRWNHLFNAKLFMNVVGSYTNYRSKTNSFAETFSLELISRLQDLGTKVDFDYYPRPGHHVQFGGSWTYHRYNPREIVGGSFDSTYQVQIRTAYQGHEFGAYISDDIQLGKRMKANVGLRLSGFGVEDTSYWGLEPRISTSYQANANIALKASYARTYQYVHLVSNTSLAAPTDIWYPTTRFIRPQEGDLVAGGIHALLFDKKFFLSIEGYYKWLRNQVEYREGANALFTTTIEDELVFGRGWSYGGEFLIRKEEGRFTGWIGYTLAWSWRQFDALNGGRKYPQKFDRRHDLSVVWSYKFNERIRLGGTWVYSTGAAVTLPTARYIITGLGHPGYFDILPQYTDRNSFRMPAYHRMDIGLWIKRRARKANPKVASDWNISLYNLYSRRNAYRIYFMHLTDPDQDYAHIGFAARKITLFPILPAATWNFTF